MTNIFQKLLPKTTEEALIEAKKSLQEKRGKIVENNLKKISEFLESEDAIPTRTQILSRNKKNLEKLTETVYGGKKPHNGIGGYGRDCDYPMELALIVIQHYTNSVLKALDQRKISPKEIDKECYGKREGGKWTTELIKNIPLDWVKSAIVTYYNASEKRGKDDSCSKEDGVISASELKECVKIVEIGNVQKYLDSLR